MRYRLVKIIFLVILLFQFFIMTANGRVGDARKTAAREEMKRIANAIRMTELDTGFIVTLRALDNISGSGSYQEIGITQFKIKSEPIPFALNSDGSFYNNTQFPYSRWKGYYITYQSVCTTGSAFTPSEYGSPLDPWGHPYRFYTAKLLTNPSTGDLSGAYFSGFTLVSFGPDGFSGYRGTQPGSGDDIIYRF